jgi:dUTP pyrophosphatase
MSDSIAPESHSLYDDDTQMQLSDAETVPPDHLEQPMSGLRALQHDGVMPEWDDSQIGAAAQFTLGQVPVSVQLLEHACGLPVYASVGSSGFDLQAAIVAPMDIPVGQVILVPSGLKMAIPVGYEIQVRSRSGLALKHAVCVINSPGTVDSDYRGELGVLLHNTGPRPFRVERGDRIAQAVLCPIMQASLQQTTQLPSTVRGEGGYGSTGR